MKRDSGASRLIVIIVLLAVIAVAVFFALGGDIDIRGGDADPPEVTINPPDVSVDPGDAPSVSVGDEGGND